jgi:hypothetical protein
VFLSGCCSETSVSELLYSKKTMKQVPVLPLDPHFAAWAVRLFFHSNLELPGAVPRPAGPLEQERETAGGSL